MWDRVLVLLSVLVACLLVFHTALPNDVGRLGSLLETFLPWLGLSVPVLLGLALPRRSVVVWCASLLPVLAWFSLFGGLLVSRPGPEYDITVLQHNVSDENRDPSGTARKLLKPGAELIALEELTPPALPDFAAVLAPDYPHHATVGTVGLWSKFPLVDVRRVDIRPEGIEEGWDRGMRATARTPQGDVAVYVAHLPSVRIGLAEGLTSARRDESAALLGAAIATERLDRVILVGDLNSTMDDRGLAPLSSRLNAPRSGFAFSWPAGFPLARIDQIMARSGTVPRVWSLPATGSDHLPIAARVRFDKTADSGRDCQSGAAPCARSGTSGPSSG
ncbi:endonuclease/exonuclease/phosphatase family protein [Streptomyces sp. AK02-01A]|nr:endonuclease/exonuclease/phosphatase family protein [Streptomyces sp. AK02-01A]MDX3853469.1 endonuclease/exonuclease/phosphatase family protein [Streptomyces sp. AK02-01A]